MDENRIIYSCAILAVLLVVPLSALITVRLKRSISGLSILIPICLVALLCGIITFIFCVIGNNIYVEQWSLRECGSTSCLRENDAFGNYMMMAGLAFMVASGLVVILSLATSVLTLLVILYTYRKGVLRIG